MDCRRYDLLQNRLRASRKEILLFCEHPPTITAGLQSRSAHLLSTVAQIEGSQITFIDQKRGGSYTAHEPGQVVVYPHIDLSARGIRISTFIGILLDTTAIALKRAWNLQTTPMENAPGLYLQGKRKIASIGLIVKKDFSSYGVAVNVENSLQTFRHIVPCGHSDLPVTSVKDEGGSPQKKNEFINFWEEEFLKQIQ